MKYHCNAINHPDKNAIFNTKFNAMFNTMFNTTHHKTAHTCGRDNSKKRFYRLSGGLFLSLLLGLSLAACTVGPDYHSPDMRQHLPAHFQNAPLDNSTGTITGTNTAKPVATTDFWWQSFNDPALNDLEQLALQRNYDLAGAGAAIRQARAQAGIITSATQPQLENSDRISRDRISRNSENMANMPLPDPKTSFTDYRAGFDASWEIDLFGYNDHKNAAAQARLAAIEQQHRDVALRISAEVARNVIDYRITQQRLQNAGDNLTASQQLLKLLTLQQQAGLLSNSDLTAAQSAVHTAAAALPPLHEAAAAAISALTVLVNLPQDQLLERLRLPVAAQTDTGENAETRPEIKLPLTTPPAGLPSELLQRRPDLRMAERQLAAATADIGVAVADQYPRLALTGNAGWDSVTPGKLTQQASRFWSIAPQLSLPLFTGGRLTAQIALQEAARDAALASYHQAVLAALADTETALIRYQQEQLRQTQLMQTVDVQRRQLDFARQRYYLGDTAFSGVLNARMQLAQLNEQQLLSRQALATNLIALFKALGGGFE